MLQCPKTAVPAQTNKKNPQNRTRTESVPRQSMLGHGHGSESSIPEDRMANDSDTNENRPSRLSRALDGEQSTPTEFSRL
ncbi:hypothetical protein BC830DRAFT_816398 [Chytriomyces sp. MP71]|nr:hypothetical protein BC830DRAFT_816398 [Chytriomyces sp. MP71]